nr:hypothetical protein [Acidimicrobiia bacterium]
MPSSLSKVRASTNARAADAVVVPVASDGMGGRPAGADGEVPWAFLEARGFKGKAGEVVAANGADGPVLYVGVGQAAAVDAAVLR